MVLIDAFDNCEIPERVDAGAFFDKCIYKRLGLEEFERASK